MIVTDLFESTPALDGTNPYGYQVGQTVKLQNGSQGQVVDIFDDSIEVLLPGGRTMTVDFRDAEVLDEYGVIEALADGGEKDRQWSNKDMEKLRVATRDFDDILSADGPDAFKQDLIKKRIQTKPMAGPKGVLPEHGMAEASNELAAMKHQRDHSTQKYADRSNSLAQRSFSMAQVPNVTKSADGHPTVKYRTDRTGKAGATRVDPTITPTTVNRKDSDKPIPAFLKKQGSMSEGLNNSKTIITEALIAQKLWENAGRKLMEAQLTADQINQIFQQIQQGATAAGGNRTMIGQGKDAATAVSKAWTDLKDKIYNSKPMTGFAAQYDKAAEKLKQATGGDAGAMKYVQKYRDFATKNPMLQSAIYAALIAASGISGVGVAGAAALGLFKLVDQALQGKDIRSAAWSGVKTGATAFAAGQIGQALKGQPAGADGLGGQVPPDMQNAIAADQAKMDWFQNKYSPGDGFTYQGSGDSLSVFDAAGRKVFSGDIPFQSLNAEQFAGLAQNGQNVATMVNQGAGVAGDAAAGITNAATNVAATGGRVARDAVLKGAMQAADEALQAGTVTDYNSMSDTIAEIMSRYEGTAPVSPQSLKTIEDMIRLKLQAGMAGGNGILQGGKAVAGAAANAVKESVTLSESQIFLVIGKIVERQRKLDEGIMDTIKGAAGKAVNYAKTKGTNLTTKITADKLLQAWKKAGSPTDSVEVYKVITGAGVPTQVAADTYSAMKIPMTAPKGGAGAFGAMSSQLRGGPQQAGAAPSVKPATAGANAFGGMAAQLGAAAPTATPAGATAPAKTGAPTGFNAANVMKMPGMEKSATAPTAPAVTTPATTAPAPVAAPAAGATRQSYAGMKADGTPYSNDELRNKFFPSAPETPDADSEAPAAAAAAPAAAPAVAAAAAPASGPGDPTPLLSPAQLAAKRDPKAAAPTAATKPTTAATTFPGEDPQGAGYVGRREVARRQAARDAAAAKKPATPNFAGPAGYSSVNYAPNIKTGINLPKPTGAAPAAAPATKVTSGGPTTAEKDKLAQRIAQAVKEPVAEMLQMVETKEDVAKIKQFVDQTFVRYGAVNESAFAVRNQILEHVTQVGAQRRREHARMS